MNIAEMMQQSAVLTLLGMSVVFGFLWLMIICVNLVGKAVHALGLDKDIQPKAEIPEKTSGKASAEITAVITAAVTEYRKGNEYHE
jgi:oxaloacetate decarboxylase gamma subunit